MWLQYSNEQVFVNASPSPVLVDTINRLIEWNLSNISSGTYWQAELTFFTPQTVALHTVLHFSASVSNSSCSSLDSLLTLHDFTVLGSYDPNDKSVSPVGVGYYGRIVPNTELTYTIQFQNTGTYAAQNVRVTDTISSYLDITSLKVLSASSNYELSISGREVTFMFTNINLPDSNTSEPNSHGYIQYSIKPNNTFLQNNLLQNTADIYFDFNAPIRTNTTRNMADNSVGMAALQSEELKFTVYPNPVADGSWHLSGGSEIIGKKMELFDVAGRLIYDSLIINSSTEIDASKFSQGVYILKIENSSVRIMKF